jgi:hypothetical protein
MKNLMNKTREAFYAAKQRAYQPLGRQAIGDIFGVGHTTISNWANPEGTNPFPLKHLKEAPLREFAEKMQFEELMEEVCRVFAKPAIEEKATPQVVEDEEVKEKMAYATEGSEIDILDSLFEQAVLYIIKDAETHDGLYSITIIHNRFIDKIPGDKRPVDFLRRDSMKRQLELFAKAYAGVEVSIPRGTRFVTDIPDIPGVIVNDPIRGWCVHWDLYLAYAGFIDERFKFLSMRTVGRAAAEKVTAKEEEGVKNSSTSELSVLTTMFQQVFATMSEQHKVMVKQNKEQERRYTELVAGLGRKLIETTATYKEEVVVLSKDVDMLQKSKDVLKADLDKKRNNWKGSRCTTPLGYYTIDGLTEGLIKTLQPVLSRSPSKTLCARLVYALAHTARYLTRWYLTPPPQNVSNLVELPEDVEFEGPAIGTYGCPRDAAGNPTKGAMYVAAATTSFYDPGVSGIQYEEYFSVYGFGHTLQNVINQMRWESKDEFSVPSSKAWSYALNVGRKNKHGVKTKARRETIEYLATLTQDPDAMASFLSKWNKWSHDEVVERHNHKCIQVPDSNGNIEWRLQYERGNPDVEKLANYKAASVNES